MLKKIVLFSMLFFIGLSSSANEWRVNDLRLACKNKEDLLINVNKIKFSF